VAGTYTRAFKLADGDGAYTVTTAASTWRFKLEQSGGAGQSWEWAGNATEPFFATWCDNTATFSDTNDSVIYADPIYIDNDVTLESIDPGYTYHFCGAVCTQVDTSKTGIAALRTEEVLQGSYTYTIKDEFLIATNSGIKIGTESTPVPIAKQFTFNGADPDGYTYTRIVTARNVYGMQGRKSSFQCYGEVISDRDTTLDGDAASGQKDIVTTDDMSAVWVAGDNLYIGKNDSVNNIDANEYEIDSISGTTITLTANLNYKKIDDGPVILTTNSRYSVILQSTNSLARSLFVQIYQPKYLYIEGAMIKGFFVYTYANNYSWNFTRHMAPHAVVEAGLKFEGCHAVDSWFLPQVIQNDANSGAFYILDGITLEISAGNTAVLSTSATAPQVATITNNKFYETNYACPMTFQNFVNFTMTGNEFWGNGATSAASVSRAIEVKNIVNPIDISNNKYNNCITVWSCETSTLVNFKEVDSEYGDEAVSVADWDLESGSYLDVTIESPTGTPVIDVTDRLDWVLGSRFGIADVNDAVGDNKGWWKYGNWQSSGTGLTDTTVHTAGGYALRFESTNSSYNADWEFNIPTGDIKDKEMMVGVWVKVNNANFYSGTHEMPRLTVDYDNGTTGYAEAANSTDWQFIFIAFTPLTTFGQISVTLSGRTDQTGSDAYIYWDDFRTMYPAESPLNTQPLDLWANALPVTPPLATVLSALDVWDAATSAADGSGTFGEKLGKKVLTTAKFLGLK